MRFFAWPIWHAWVNIGRIRDVRGIWMALVSACGLTDRQCSGVWHTVRNAKA